ncbi:MAG: ferrochelatase [Halioglobus sp.]|nr:ferrochelatase [Halioglobus sp.]|tara:strand:+ start:773 stop:1819 length:1047 start_codon:yes stop_codon:yes gene_type:complete
MKYIGTQGFDHEQPARSGLLITNLGTPDAPDKAALKRYLREFLWDPRVVEVPRPLWWLILNLVILNVRPARSARAYRTVWSEAGSPLLVHTRAQRDALRAALAGQDVVVEFAMRYGKPSIPAVLQSMAEQGVRRLVVLPLYPQYSAATTASTFDRLAEDFTRRRWLPELRFVTHYHDHPAYVAAIADSIEAHRQAHGGADLLLFSYHGVPQRYLDEGDPYHCECLKTSRLVAERLGLTEEEYRVCFQSRFGREEWLKPYTDETLKGLPAEGVRSVQVVCPGFAADCLETLEEIGVENRDYFLHAGGEHYQYIPCLNSSAAHIDALRQVALDALGDWVASPVGRASPRP